MSLPVNQFRTLEKKLVYYDKPFIERDLLQQIIDKFAPNYQIKALSARGLLSPIIKGKLYLNLCSRESIRILPTTILEKYMHGKTYMIGGLYLYNHYGYTQQLADRITVYNTHIHGKRIIAGRKFIFRKVTSVFFRGMEEVDAQGYAKYIRMSRERALIQIIAEKKGVLEYEDDIYDSIHRNNISPEKVLKLAKKHSSKRVVSLVQQFLNIG